MLSIRAIKAGNEDYYLNLVAGDYYLNGGEPPGKWMGGGCRVFNLVGEVEPTEFKRFFRGFHPFVDGDGPKDGPPRPQKLVQNAGRKNRQNGWDLTFSLPKSISVIWSQADRTLRKQVEQLCEEALEETLAWTEAKLGFSRTGTKGSGKLAKANLSFAVFQHGTSRAGDPQLHWHCLLMNVGYCEDGKSRSIISKPIYKNKMLLGAVFRSKVAFKLHKAMGLKMQRKGNSCDVIGVPQATIDAHSTRRKQILADMKKKGRIGAKAAALSAVETRPEKEHRPRKELFEEWRQTNAEFGFDDKALKKLIRPVTTDYAEHIPTILATALENTKLRLSHFTAHDFMREVLYVAPEYGVPLEGLEKPLHKFIRESSEIVPIPTTDGSCRFVAASVLEQEHKMLKQLATLQERTGSQVSDEALIKTLGSDSHLTREQRQAVRHLTLGESAIRVIQGYAGSGKTTMLRTAVEAWKASGFNVVGACFTGAAAEVLEHEIGVPCDTINMTLADFNRDLVDYLKRWSKHSFKQLVRAARGEKTYKQKAPTPVKINRKTIVLVDEAGMVGTRHMLMLMKWANENGATLVLTGDEAQLAAVQGGSPLQSISRRVGCTRMTDIKRQQSYWASTAAYYLAKGEIAKALALFDERGMLKVDDNTDEALERLINDWDAHSFDRLAQSRILTLTNDLAEQANQLAQQKLLQRKVLDTSSRKTIFDVDDNTGKVYKSTVHIGDRILFTQNNRNLEIRNGHTGTIIGFTLVASPRPQQALKVLLDNGRVVKVPLSFKHMRLGYASTVYKAQGSTYEEVFVLLAGGTQNLPLSYVQGTRSRLATHFYTERALYDQIYDLGESPLVSQMEREVDLSLASDLFVPPNDVGNSTAELIQNVVEDWKQHDSAKSLIVAKNQSDAKQINQQCHKIQYAIAQSEWEKRRKLDGEKTAGAPMPTYTCNGATTVVGDRVRLHRGNIDHGINEHELGTVTELTPDKLGIQLDRGKLAEFKIDNVPDLEHGYAASYEQAHVGRYRMEQGLLVEPEKYHSIATHNQPDFLQWNPVAEHTQTIYSQSNFLNSSINQSFQFQTVKTYMDNSMYSQMAADWHQKTYQINQSPSWQIPMDYSYTKTHSQYSQGI